MANQLNHSIPTLDAERSPRPEKEEYTNGQQIGRIDAEESSMEELAPWLLRIPPMAQVDAKAADGEKDGYPGKAVRERVKGQKTVRPPEVTHHARPRKVVEAKRSAQGMEEENGENRDASDSVQIREMLARGAHEWGVVSKYPSSLRVVCDYL